MTAGYTYGECTYYVDSVTPWIQGDLLGDAKDWLSRAAQYGLQEGTVPIPGSIAVIEPGQPGVEVSPLGHVAKVDSVNTDGSVTLSDMNWNYELGVVQQHDLPASAITGYIYAPSGDTSTALQQAANPSLTAAQLAGWTFGPFNNNTPGIGGLGDVVQTIGGVPGTIANTIGQAVGGFLQAIAKGFEIFVGVAFMVAGIWILVTHSKTGGQAVTVLQSGAKKAAEIGALAA